MRSLGAFRRIIAAVAGLWLTIALVEPVGLHACPMHDALHGGHTVVASMVGGADGRAETPDAGAPDLHRHHHHHDHGAPSGPPTGDATAAVPDHSTDGDTPHAVGCLCVGSCCAASVVAVPDAETTETAALVATAHGTPVGPTSAPRSSGGLVLPFANGPPTPL